MKNPSISLDDMCCAIGIIDECVNKQQQTILKEENLERCLMLSNTIEEEDPNLKKEVIELEGESLSDVVLGTKEEPHVETTKWELKPYFLGWFNPATEDFKLRD